MRITAFLIGVCIIVFTVQVISEIMFCQNSGNICIEGIDPFTYTFSLIPINALHGAWWQFITYMFLHGGIGHLMFNMFVLFLFGSVVEHALGKKRFLLLYIISGIGAAFLHIVLSGVSYTIMLGASGAIFGILAAYGFMFPRNKIIVFPIPFPLPAWIAVVGIAILEFLIGVYGLESGVANFGHLGGILTGAVLVYYWKHKKPKSIWERRRYEFFWE